MNASQMARALGRRGGRARGKRLSRAEKKRIASLGGKARARSLLAARRISDNFRYVAVLDELAEVHERHVVGDPVRLLEVVRDDHHGDLLAHNPYRIESYQKLYKLYFDARAYDKAWCLASTLAFLEDDHES